MKYAIEMASGGMIYVPSFMIIGTGIQNLLDGIHLQAHRHIHRQKGYLISLFFSKQGMQANKMRNKSMTIASVTIRLLLTFAGNRIYAPMQCYNLNSSLTHIKKRSESAINWH
jgi:hypothetical protein